MSTEYRGWTMRRRDFGFQATKGEDLIAAYTIKKLFRDIDKTENHAESKARIDALDTEGLING